MEVTEKNWILSFDELRILLFSLGYTQCDGIFMEEKKFTDEQVLQAMYSMSKQSWIVNNGSNFEIQPELKKALLLMGNPQSTAKLVNPETRRACFVYKGKDMIVVAERWWPKKDTIQIRSLSFEEFKAWRKGASL